MEPTFSKPSNPATGERTHGGLADRLGICQWFHFEAYDDLERSIASLRELGVRHLRTGVSWADYHRPTGKSWYDHQMQALAEFDVLLSVWHTPPSIARGGTCASPPQRLEHYAEFIEELIEDYGDHFSCLELWNEPNNLYKWDFARFDPDWSLFGTMIRMAGETAHDLQCERLLKAAAAPADRLYWYSLMELDPRREAIEGFHVDENEYHLGLVTHTGEKKPVWSVFRELLQ